MNKIRAVITVFMAAVVVTAILGWRWSAVLPPAKQEGARLVLVLASVASIIAAFIIWSAKPLKKAA